MIHEWESVSNPDIQLLHTDRRFSVAYDVGKERPNWYGEWPAEDKALLLSITDIHGVESLSVQTYELHIKKGRVFKWQELQPQILAILERAAQPDARAPRHIRLQAQENS